MYIYIYKMWLTNISDNAMIMDPATSCMNNLVFSLNVALLLIFCNAGQQHLCKFKFNT